MARGVRRHRRSVTSPGFPTVRGCPRMSADPQTVAPRRYLSRLTRGTLAVIMAGGRGERLKHLTEDRCKPATPFGGKFRIIDFVLSNCVNSGIRQISVLTQYKAHSLIQHIQRGWGYLRGEFGEFVEIIPAQQQLGDALVPRHRGLALTRTWRSSAAPPAARAGARRRSHLQDGLRPDDRLPRREESRHHRGRRRGAARARAQEFGVMTVDDSNRIMRFPEKPTRSRRRSPAGRARGARLRWASTCSMRSCSSGCCDEDAEDPDTAHDFGRNIIPGSARQAEGVRLPVRGRAHQARSITGATSARSTRTTRPTWSSCTSIPDLNIYDEQWPIWTYQDQLPPAKFVLRRRRPARHGDQLDGVGRLHHLGVAGRSIRCCSRMCASTT